MNLHILALIVSAIIGLVIPLVSAAVHQEKWPSEVVGLITIACAAVTGFVAQWVASPSWTAHDFQAALVTAGLALLAAFQAQARVWIYGGLEDRLRQFPKTGRAPPER